MTENSPDIVEILREQGARYVVDAENRPVAVLLSLEEYEHYLDLLDDEQDSRDPELKARLVQAADRLDAQDRISFRDYLHQRRAADENVSR